MRFCINYNYKLFQIKQDRKMKDRQERKKNKKTIYEWVSDKRKG